MARGQYYNLTFRNYLSHNSIAQSEVDAIFEDSRGFLWLGTHFGLTRFDGREFRHFYHHVDDSTTIGDNEISSIDEDSKGNIWISMFNSGFTRMDPRTSRFTNFLSVGRHALPSKKVEMLLADRSDRIWLGTDKGISIYYPDTRTFLALPTPAAAKEPLDVLCLVEERGGQVLAGTRNEGLWRVDAGMKGSVQLLDATQVGEVRDIYELANGDLWLACSEGLFRLIRQASRYTLERAPFFPQRESLVDVEVDAQGNIWMASMVDGVFIYFPSSGFMDHLRENFSSARGLLSNRLFELYQDSQFGIWLGGENGLQYYQYRTQKFNIYPGLSNISDQLRGSTLYGIVELDNDIIMATSGGLLVYNRVTNRYVPVEYPANYKPGSVRFRYLDWEGPAEWWITSDQGMFRLRQKQGYYVVDRPPVLSGSALFRTKNIRKYLKKDGVYWFALAAEGLMRWRPSDNSMLFFTHKEGDSSSIPNDVINQMDFDREGNIMLGLNEGMSVLNPSTLRFRHFMQRESIGSPGLNSRYVYDMYDDGKSYWLGTFGGGLNQVDKVTGAVRYFTTRDGLCNDGIYTLVPDNNQQIWIGTAKGLSRFSTDARQFVNFSIEDGLPSDEFNMLSRHINNEGEIFMGTMNGLVSFNGQDLYKSNLSPRILLSRIRLNGLFMPDSAVSEVSTGRRLVTRYGEGVYMEFSPMIFSGNTNLSIRYKLNAGDTAWRMGEAGGIIPLIRNEPGTYNLVVQLVRNGSGELSPEWKMQFVVMPLYWQTLGFRLAMVALGLMLLVLAIRSYIQRRLQLQRTAFERAQAVEKERARISAELHDDIGGGLTAIRLMSEMMRESGVEGKGKSFATRISASSNELVQKMNEIVWALNVNNDNLQSLISYTREFIVGYLDDFDLECQVSIPAFVPDVHVTGTNRRDIFLLVKESLNNVVKHAQATTVEVRMEIDKNLRISIRDNGRGFDPSGIRQGANGLANMRKRVGRLKARMDIRSDEGTTVRFDIPLQSMGQTSMT